MINTKDNQEHRKETGNFQIYYKANVINRILEWVDKEIVFNYLNFLIR